MATTQSDTADNAIVVKNLQKSFKDIKVLHGIDITVRRGSILALLGPNGAGKTTTIRILSTLLPPDGGEARVNGYDVVKQACEVRSSIGLTGQFAAVDAYLTGEENLLMLGRLYRLSRADTKRRTRELLEQFDLVDAARRPVKTYSGGMKRRLDLAMSLIAAPPDYLFGRADDGPGSEKPPGHVGLDQKSGQQRRDDSVDHAVHGRSGSSGRLDRGHRRGQGDCGGRCEFTESPCWIGSCRSDHLAETAALP